MKNKQQGFGLVVIVIIIGLIAFLYFYKDKNGVSYYEKVISTIGTGKQGIDDSLNDYKKTMENRDKEIEQNLE
jgi:hypothetical protein